MFFAQGQPASRTMKSLLLCSKDVSRHGLSLLLAFLAWAFITMPAFAQTGASDLAMGGERSSLVFGLLVGVLLTACFYLFFIWTVFRDLSQMLLILMLLFLVTHLSMSNDLVVQTFGIGDLVTLQYLQNFALIGFYIASLFFTLTFLDVGSHMPGMGGALYIAIGMQVLLLVFAAVVDRKLVHFFMPTIGSLTIGLILFTGLLGMYRQVSGSAIHLLAFSIYLIGGMASPLHDLGVFGASFGINNLMYFASATSAILFAVVIAGQFTAQQETSARALAKSNERFSLAALGANEGLYDWDLVNNTVYFSDRFKKIVGKNLRDSAQGIKDWMRLIHAPDRLRVRQALRQFRRSKDETIDFEYRLLRPDNKRRWLYSTGVATRDPASGKVVRLVGSLGDITAKKAGEFALKDSEARFRSITEAHPVPVLIARARDGALAYVSPGAEPMLAVTQADVMGRNLANFFARPDDAQKLFARLEKDKQANMEEFAMRRADGTALPVAVSARLIDYDHEPAAVIGLYDLSERKRAEAQIAKQQDALQQSEKMAALGGLLAGVAHELNNPLSVIVGQATLLGEGSKEEKTVSRADKIFKAAERCSRIVRSFLAIARRKPPERREMQLNSTVAAGLELLAYQLRNENVELKLELFEGLPPIVGDRDQLTQVVTNLVLNAAQAMQGWDGKRIITIKTAHDAAQKTVSLDVSDTGPGVPDEIRTRVFEPFFTTKAPGAGTGVGLSLCLNIVEAHGGRLELRETEGGGATFHITMPVPDTGAGIADDTQAQVVQPVKGLRLLLVDDEIELAQTLADMLQPDGHSFDFAVNGQVGLEKMLAGKYDFVISDLRMPVMDGPTMYQKLCEAKPDFAGNIIFVTGDTLTENVRDFLEQNPVAVVEKPYTLNDIRRALEQQLRKTA
ncbi:MAG: PAS domain S-box protein [Alphaproteobacteria bacterium]|nr:PAS domain S-box protein [Alphaproteobacteria bacterium]